tara:strand:+ start:8730 stop:9068 length:339 start_codon:yes stop_codon:yes gene_type:complete
MNKKLIKMDGYDDCIVGVVERAGEWPILCYDKEKVLSKLERGTTCPLCEGSGDLDGFGGGGKTKCHRCEGTGGRMSRSEAEEFFYYNQMGAWMGDSTPCFLSKELDKYELLS